MMGQIFVWTLSDVLYVIVGILLLGALALVSVAEWWRQSRCKHDGGVNETQACDAICRKCGKNLGFIGNWRKSNGA
jgi:hypothetical protein